MPYGNIWDDERDAYLRQCRADGLTFSECQAAVNQKFQVYYSRNACIVRAKRIGIGESMDEIRLRRSQVAVKREEKKRFRAENPERAPRRRRTYSVVEPTVEPVPLAPVKPTTIPLGSIASRVVQAAKKVDQEKALAERRMRPFGDTHVEDQRPLRCVEVVPLNLSIMQLDATTCHYPYGGWPEETPITFCGHGVAFKDAPYCFAHQRLTHAGGTFAERNPDNVSEKDAA